ncbi:hypothetical protein HPE56_19180 [Maribacter sp. ANRC-HE7]|uniref:DoxX family protein n=1 Tax=Maribacter aquimaris TaxID=2737171 RepID=A0ABR7V9C0_9FLAO|nr:DUF6544 family protein [Maribacter aquimaris]MBD0779927.1 hypothetical protein [Maribacter aquimaris]
MKTVLTCLIIIHGLIHVLGFAKAIDFGNLTQFTKQISIPMGVIWLLTGLLFVLTALILVLKSGAWPILALITVVTSQILIITAWEDAKFGSIANSIILIAAIIGLSTQSFQNRFRKDILSASDIATITTNNITENDLVGLPKNVQDYLRYVGVVGKPKIHNVRIVFEGAMRDKGKDWFNFTSEQYNFFQSPTRLFFMKAKIKGIPINGYHKYDKEGARMQIKLLSLFPVVDIDGPKMFPTETVTFLNDLCLFAPGALIDDRIRWETIDELSVKATFTTNGTSISAILYFNEKGQLVNFVSNDRYSVSEMKTFPFSTPVKNYQNINGYNLPTYGEAIWHYPGGEFIYGKFNVKRIEYNVTN